MIDSTSSLERWIKVPVPLTVEMEIAFSEAWFSKRRCLDDVEMADAWEAACEAAPSAPADPRAEALSRQLARNYEMLRNAGAARDKLNCANEELLSLLSQALDQEAEGFYQVDMCPEYRQKIREALYKHDHRRPNAVDQDVERLQQALGTERPDSGDIRGYLYDKIARTESERDAALGQLKALQDQSPAVKLIVVHSGHEAEPKVHFSEEFGRHIDSLPAGAEVKLYTQPSPPRFSGEGLAKLTFPTMLRQMWSGGDVQAWINQQGPVYAWPSLQRAAFQSRVAPWLVECFGQQIALDCQERIHRFLEEALELVQACGCTTSEAQQLVDYVFSRQAGERSQEVGGVMVTLAALCYAQGVDMHQSAELELHRVSAPGMMTRIREKQRRKPPFEPLPGVYPDRIKKDSVSSSDRTARP